MTDKEFEELRELAKQYATDLREKNSKLIEQGVLIPHDGKALVAILHNGKMYMFA